VDDVPSPVSITSAAGVTIADAGGHYVATDVEAALQELGANTGAGIVGTLDAGGNFVSTNVEATLAEIVDDLAATTSGNGAAKVGIEDSAGDFTATTVEGALAELKVDGGETIVVASNYTATDSFLSPFSTSLPVSGGRYHAVKGVIIWDHTGGDIDMKFNIVSSITFDSVGYLHAQGVALSNHFAGLFEDTSSPLAFTSSIKVITVINAVLRSNSGSTFNFQVQRNSPSGVTTVYEGSWMKVTKLPN
jgi:hypothetical protein